MITAQAPQPSSRTRTRPMLPLAMDAALVRFRRLLAEAVARELPSPSGRVRAPMRVPPRRRDPERTESPAGDMMTKPVNPHRSRACRDDSIGSVATGRESSAAGVHGRRSKTVRIIVPYPAGGATRISSAGCSRERPREVARPDSRRRQQLRRGAVRSAPPKSPARNPTGYTVLVTITDPLINNVALFKNARRTTRGRTSRSSRRSSRSPALVSANVDLPVKSFEDLRKLRGQPRPAR